MDTGLATKAVSGMLTRPAVFRWICLTCWRAWYRLRLAQSDRPRQHPRPRRGRPFARRPLPRLRVLPLAVRQHFERKKGGEFYTPRCVVRCSSQCSSRTAARQTHITEARLPARQAGSGGRAGTGAAPGTFDRLGSVTLRTQVDLTYGATSPPLIRVPIPITPAFDADAA